MPWWWGKFFEIYVLLREWLTENFLFTAVDSVCRLIDDALERDRLLLLGHLNFRWDCNVVNNVHRLVMTSIIFLGLVFH